VNSLKTNNLTKCYNKRIIVNSISIELQQNNIVGLLGPNGAGKTTCFYMILGLIKCDLGSIWLNNQEITFMPIHERAKLGLGYLPQEPSIFRKLSVEDNILSVLEVVNKNRLISNDSGIVEVSNEQKLNNFLLEFNLNHVRKNLAISLSGGERRRLEIARTLASKPKFILLDEPFAGIDPIAIGDIKKILKNLTTKNIGILITDHNVRETLDICDKAYVISNGQMIAEGDMKSITNNQQVKEVYLGQEFNL
jgi:lipopolysaccharide export system ATP-binding protein